MSTIDIGIADTPETLRNHAQPAVAVLPRVAPAPVVVDDGFYVGSVKIERRSAAPRDTSNQSLVAVTT